MLGGGGEEPAEEDEMTRGTRLPDRLTTAILATYSWDRFRRAPDSVWPGDTSIMWLWERVT